MYIIWSYPSIVLMGLNDLQRKFLIEVGKSKEQVKVMMIGCPLHILWSYIFVIVMDLEIIGTAIAMVITNSTLLLGNLYITNRQEDL